MKKLLFIAFVAAGFMQDASAMIFRKTKDGRYLPAFLVKEYIKREELNDKQPLVKLLGDESRAIEHTVYETEEYETPEGRIARRNETEEYTTSEGKIARRVTNRVKEKWLIANARRADKLIVKQWCDDFKKNSKKPAMWNELEEVEERKIEKVYNCIFRENQEQNLPVDLRSEVVALNHNNLGLSSKSDFKFLDDIQKLQDNEWKQWQIRTDTKITGIAVDYQEKKRERPLGEKAALFVEQCLTSRPIRSVNSTKTCIVYDQSPCYKAIEDKCDDNIYLANGLENNVYHEALQSLQVTEEVIKRDLHDQSYVQRLWNYGKRKNTHKALELMQNEIESFIEVKNRDAFTRSSMSHLMFEKVKKARE